MPCYDPPPPWEGRERKNAEQAVRLLCGFVSVKVNAGEGLEKELLEWFLEHKQIDLEIATTEYYGRPNKEDAERAKREIELTNKLLGA